MIRDAGRLAGPSPWSTRHSWVLAALVLAGSLWRLRLALGAPWFEDEGYVVEWARTLAYAPLARAHLGALWEDGFFPLSTSFLAPLSAAPFTLLPGCSPILGARLWALCLDLLALGALVLLVRPRDNPRLALIAAACYSLLPFAAEFGARAFYHHFAVVLMLACLALGRGLWERERAVRVVPASLCAGLALAGCYWLWWLPLSWAVLLAWKRPKGWGWALALTALPPLAVLGTNFLPDPRGAWWSVQGMLKTGGKGGGLRGCAAWWTAFRVNVVALPFLGVGLLGLAWAALRRRGPWPWFLACLACAILEPLRQRGAGVANLSYPFQIAAPLASLGAAAMAERLLEPRKMVGALVAGVGLFVFFMPVNLGWLDNLGVDPAAVRGLDAFIQANSRPGDLVCGLPNFNWTFRPRLRVCQPSDAAAAEGLTTIFYPAGIPSSRMAYPCGIGDIRFAVTSTLDLYLFFHSTNLCLPFLEMERSGWPLVFSSPGFRVYENPRFGVKPDADVRILQTPANYEIAYGESLGDKRPDLAAFAARRLGAMGDPFHTPGARP